MSWAEKRGFEKMSEMRNGFGLGTPDAEIDPLIPRFRLIDERDGSIIARFALDREYAPGETVTLPSIRVKMPR